MFDRPQLAFSAVGGVFWPEPWVRGGGGGGNPRGCRVLLLCRGLLLGLFELFIADSYERHCSERAHLCVNTLQQM
jgi:hypothetical protein